MISEARRVQRSLQAPIVGGLPDVPGIAAAFLLTPGLGEEPAWAGRRAVGARLPRRDDQSCSARAAGDDRVGGQ